MVYTEILSSLRSILGPLLLITYINYLSLRINSVLEPILFVNDVSQFQAEILNISVQCQIYFCLT